MLCVIIVVLFSHSFQRYNVVAKSIAYYFLPLSIIAVLYALMARRLNVSAREMPGELAGPQRAQARARRHVARMVVTFVIGTITSQHAIIYTFICVCTHLFNAIQFITTHPYHFIYIHLISVFTICFLPYHVFMLWFHL